ncbi:hypothetical protein K2173_017492 [Erythroxylum novogranatense]|uniref:Uncharacterized protein n=1 Tax=Erythroxylum novogranatense TaxID=1862640 RepID=A0AAV8TNK4_9ROSI|nr:hypothetical protein K2173_017492 [Erythroxylum novogranatense]
MEPPNHDKHQSKHVCTRKQEEDQAPQQKSSYSSAVTGTLQASVAATVPIWPDEELVDVEEGDIIQLLGDDDGGITISQKLGVKLDNQWVQTVVVKVLDRKIGFRTFNMCFTCDMVDHVDAAYPKRPPASLASPPLRNCDDGVMNGQKNASAIADGDTMAPTSNGYGPWMLVHNRPQHSSQPHQTQMGRPKDSVGDGMACQEERTKHSDSLGEGLRMNLSSLLSKGKQIVTRPVFTSIGPKRNSKKGPKNQKLAMIQKDLGESSRGKNSPGDEAQEARPRIEEGTSQHPDDPPDISLESVETEAMPTQLPE